MGGDALDLNLKDEDQMGWKRAEGSRRLSGGYSLVRNLVYVILAVFGYLVLHRLIDVLIVLVWVFGYYYTWLPIAGFTYWRLAPLTQRPLQRSLLFAALFSPVISPIFSGNYGIFQLHPLVFWSYFAISTSLAEPSGVSFEMLGKGLAYVLGPFLLFWVVAYRAMLSRPGRDRGAPQEPVNQDPLSGLRSESRKDRGLIVGLTGLFVITGALGVRVWEQYQLETQERKGLVPQVTAQSRALSTAEANLSAVIEQAATLRAEVQQQLTPALRDVNPPSSEEARSFSSSGTGPITIFAGSSELLRFQLSELASPIQLVRSLTLHIQTADTSRTGPTTLDLIVWDFGGAWEFGDIEERVAWGNTSIDIGPADRYVSKAGEIYIQLRNFRGAAAIDLEDVNFTLVVLNADGTQSVYAPTQ